MCFAPVISNRRKAHHLLITAHPFSSPKGASEIADDEQHDAKAAKEHDPAAG